MKFQINAPVFKETVTTEIESLGKWFEKYLADQRNERNRISSNQRRVYEHVLNSRTYRYATWR